MHRAGRLDSWVRLMQSVETPDSYGDPVETFVEVEWTWAGIESLRGKEFFEAQQTNAEQTLRIVLRYRDDVKHTWQIEHEGHTYAVTSPPMSDRRADETILMCKELT